MAFAYTLKEGISGFKRARLSTVISIFTMTVSLLLLGLFVIIYTNTNQLIKSFRDKVEIEVFLSATTSDSVATALKTQFLDIPGIIGTTFISKDDAAKIFKKEFGEDVTTVLDFNPLPASYKLQLATEYKNSDSTKVLHDILLKYDNVDDIIYRKTLLEILDRRVKMFIAASAAIGATLLIVTLFLISNTIRLTIFAKRKMITTMKLVGATRGFIRMPFLIEGMMQGIIGGGLASAFIFTIVFLARQFIGNDLAEFISVEPYFYVVTVFIGVLLGLIGSSWSVKRFISENVVIN